MPNTIFIDIPHDFEFKASVYGHGWHDLAPFSLDVDIWRLSYVFWDGRNNPVGAKIFQDGARLRIDLSHSDFDAVWIAERTRHLLRMDDNLEGFYRATAQNPRLAWIAERGIGRLLRSSTVFEDLVKTICTTNCSWSLTKNMVSNLVDTLGQAVNLSEPSESSTVHLKSFPTATAMASVNEEFYRNEIRAGYRSPYLVELAEAVAAGKLDPEGWLDSDLPTAELKKEMKKVKGVGDYAAENLLKLVGRYDGLALDSFLRSQFYKTHNNENICPDKKIERHYNKFGEWRGLVMWCDMTKRWTDSGGQL